MPRTHVKKMTRFLELLLAATLVYEAFPPDSPRTPYGEHSFQK